MSTPHRRGPWSQSEDNRLMSLVAQAQGALNWVRISNSLVTRSPKQCRERYHQNLKPSLNHDPITPAEGNLIEQLVNDVGKRWAEIARRLKGRSDNAVKNWWNGSQNRRKRNDKRRATATQVTYNQRSDMQHQYMTAQMAVPRTLPVPSRQQPAPLLHTSLQESRYYVESPLTSPSAYSPASELPPSLMSDYGSHYSTSPQAYEERTPTGFELPPLKTAEAGVHMSSRCSTSPADTRLPPLSTLAYGGHPAYTTSPASDFSHQRLPSIAHQVDYFPNSSHPPTASNSPAGTAGLQLRPRGQREDKNTRVHVSDLLQ